jgi:GTPase SAR1 family protein
MTALVDHVPARTPPKLPTPTELSCSFFDLYTTLASKTYKMPFAQLVIGPPGSGKSTYCDGMQQFMGALERKCSVVNLDPANDSTSYQPAVDVRDLVTIDEIMEQESLGPNGGVLFALEELEHNFDWLEEGLKELGGPQQQYE